MLSIYPRSGGLSFVSLRVPVAGRFCALQTAQALGRCFLPLTFLLYGKPRVERALCPNIWCK